MTLFKHASGGKTFPPRFFILAFFLMYLLIGLLAFNDYGVSMDEGNNRIDGYRTLNFLIHGDPKILDYVNRYHGVAFSVTADLIEMALGLTRHPGAIFQMRHLLIFLIFYVSVFFFFRLLEERFRSWKVALLGSFFLIISPKIFAHSFYNAMDAVLLSFVILAFYTQSRFLQEKTLYWALWHGLCCALAFNTRVIAGMFPLLTVLFYLIDLQSPLNNSKKPTRLLIIFVAWTSALIYTLWPVLWMDPLGEIIKAFTFLSHIPAIGGSLYLGEHVYAKDVPWHYVPVWIAVTTPLSYLVLFLIGVADCCADILRRPKEILAQRRTDLLAFAWLLLPIGAVIIFKAHLYTGYRHLLFVYPAIIYIGMIGLSKIAGLWSQKTAGRFVAGTVFLFLLLDGAHTVCFMIKHHPYQDLYFNKLAGKNLGEVKKRFEMDYWGLSYREGFEFLAENIKQDKISIVVPDDTYLLSSVLLPEDQRAKFQLCNGGPRYLMTNFYFVPATAARIPYEEEELKRIGEEIYSKDIDGAKIFAIYRVPPSADGRTFRCVDVNQHLKKDHLLGYDLSGT